MIDPSSVGLADGRLGPPFTHSHTPPNATVGLRCVGVVRVRTQAFAAWQWANYSFSQVPPGRRTLRVNFDETAVCLFQGAGRGNVFLRKSDPAVQHVPIAKRRTYLTHVAFVCDDPAIQPLLPQVVIGNERTIKVRQLAALRAACPANVRILRQRSAWVNAPLIAQIVRWLDFCSLLQPSRDVQRLLETSTGF